MEKGRCGEIGKNQNLLINCLIQNTVNSEFQINNSLYEYMTNGDEAHEDLSASSAVFSCNFLSTDGGGLTTILFFHCLSSFLDCLFPIPCSISLSLFTVSMRAI